MGLVILLALPWAVGHRPLGARQTSAADLLARVAASKDAGYSGLTESVGGLALPVSQQFGAVADLLGGRTQQRVWWRGGQDNRVDTVTSFGESDVYQDVDGSWTWNYEKQQATRTVPTRLASVRLPTATDLLPPELGRRLLSEATAAEASRLPVQAIAGIDAPGLRIRPAQAASSVERVDVWVDPATGLPLRVTVVGHGSTLPAMSTTFLDFSGRGPDPSGTRFVPPPGAQLRDSDGLDVASAIDTFSDRVPPTRLAGLARTTRTMGLGAIGVYGRGVTEMVSVPLRGRFGGPLRDQLAGAPGAVLAGGSTSLGVGPVNLLLTAPGPDGLSWLLVGTVTPATLTAAAGDLAASPPPERR